MARIAYAYGPKSVRIRTARQFYRKYIPLVWRCCRKPRLSGARRRRTASGAGRGPKYGPGPADRKTAFFGPKRVATCPARPMGNWSRIWDEFKFIGRKNLVPGKKTEIRTERKKGRVFSGGLVLRQIACPAVDI